MINSDQLLQVVDILSSSPLRRLKEHLQVLQELTQFIPFFQDYINNGNEQVHEECCKNMKYRFCEENEIVFSQGEMGDHFYLILSGSVRVLVEGEEEKSTIQGMKCVKILKSGTGFGEVALIKSQPRLATIQCETQCHLATLDKASFTKILKRFEENKLLNEISIYQRIPLFSKWGQKQLRIIYLNSFRVILKKGEYLFKEGEEPKSMNIICSGEFTAHKIVEREKDEFEIGREIDKNGIFRLKDKRNIPSMKFQVKIKDNHMHKTFVIIPKKFEIKDTHSKRNKKRKLIYFHYSQQEFLLTQILQKNQSIEEKKGDSVWESYQICGQEALIKQQFHQYSVQCSSIEGEVIIINKNDFMTKVMAVNSSRQVAVKSMEMREVWYEKKLSKTKKIMENNQFKQFYLSNQLNNSNLFQAENFQVDSLQNYQMYKELGCDKSEQFKTSKTFQLIEQSSKNRIYGTKENEISTRKDKSPQYEGKKTIQISKPVIPISELEIIKNENKKLQIELNNIPFKLKKTIIHIQQQQIPQLRKSKDENNENYIVELEVQEQSSLSSPTMVKQQNTQKIPKLKIQNEHKSQSPLINYSQTSINEIQSLKLDGKEKIINKDLILSIIAPKQKDIDLKTEKNKQEQEQTIQKPKKYVYTRYKSMTNLPTQYGGQGNSSARTEKQNSPIKQKDQKDISFKAIPLQKQFSNQNLSSHMNTLEDNQILYSPQLLIKSQSLIPSESEQIPSMSKKLSIFEYQIQSNKNIENKFRNFFSRSNEKQIRKSFTSDESKEFYQKIDSQNSILEIQKSGSKSQSDTLKQDDFQSPFSIKSMRTKEEKLLNEFETILEVKNQKNNDQKECLQKVRDSLSKRERNNNFSSDNKFPDSNQQFTKSSSSKQIQLSFVQNHESPSPSKRGPIIKCKTIMSKVKELYKFEREKLKSQSPNKNDNSNRNIHNNDQQQSYDNVFSKRSSLKSVHDKLDLVEKNLSHKPIFQKVDSSDYQNKKEKQLQITQFFDKVLSMKTLESQSTSNNSQTLSFYNQFKYKQYQNQINKKNSNQIMNNFIFNDSSITNISLNNMQENIIEDQNKYFYHNKYDKDSSQLSTSDSPCLNLQNSINSKIELLTQHSQSDFKDLEYEKFLHSGSQSSNSNLNSLSKEQINKIESLNFRKKRDVLLTQIQSHRNKNVLNMPINSSRIKSDFSPYKIFSTQPSQLNYFSDFRQFQRQEKLKQNLSQKNIQ